MTGYSLVANEIEIVIDEINDLGPLDRLVVTASEFTQNSTGKNLINAGILKLLTNVYDIT